MVMMGMRSILAREDSESIFAFVPTITLAYGIQNKQLAVPGSS